MDTGQPATGRLDQAASAAGLEATSQLAALELCTGTFTHTDTDTDSDRHKDKLRIYWISGRIRCRPDIRPLFAIRFLTVKNPENETGYFYFTGHHTPKQETCDTGVTKTCQDSMDGPGAVLSETIAMVTAGFSQTL